MGNYLQTQNNKEGFKFVPSSVKISLHALAQDFEKPFIFYQECEDINPLLTLDLNNFIQPYLSLGTYVLCVSW